MPQPTPRVSTAARKRTGSTVARGRGLLLLQKPHSPQGIWYWVSSSGG